MGFFFQFQPPPPSFPVGLKWGEAPFKHSEDVLHIQCIREAFTMFHFFHIFLLLSWSKLISFQIIDTSTPLGQNGKEKKHKKTQKAFESFTNSLKIENKENHIYRSSHSLCLMLHWSTFGSFYRLQSFSSSSLRLFSSSSRLDGDVCQTFSDLSGDVQSDSSLVSSLFLQDVHREVLKPLLWVVVLLK